MEFSEAFRETMFRFNLKGSDIAERSGLTQAQVSDFRNGKNLRIDSVERILKALPNDARSHLLERVKESFDSDPS
jgi:transcriptional regulator with XRE-family HTH domain